MGRAALLLLAAFTACTPSRFDLLSSRVRSGETVAAVTGNRDYAVVLLIDPADAFKCGSHLSRWLAWSRAHPERFFLILTREPSEAEHRQMRLYRIRPDATLARRVPEPTPREYLISHGRELSSQRVKPGDFDTRLLTAAERGRVAELLHQIRSGE